MNQLPQLPAQSVPPLDDRAGDDSLPPLLSRVWWLFLYSLNGTVGALSTALSALTTSVGDLADTVFGRASLTHVGNVPQVSVAGTLGEGTSTDIGGGLKMLFPAGTQPARLGTWIQDGVVFISENLSFDTGASQWNLDDITKTGSVLRMDAIGFGYYTAPAAANPASLTAEWAVSGSTGAMSVLGVQVVSARGAALTATVAAATAAGAAYNQAVAQTAVTLANNLKVRVDQLEARLSSTGHGLFT